MLPLAVAVLVAVAAVLASLWLFLAPKLRPPLPSLHGPPTSSILLGNIDIFAAGKLHENFLAVAKGYGKFVRIRILWKWVVIVFDAEGASTLLRAGRRAVVKPTSAYWFFNRVTVPPCENILSSSDDDPLWKAVRAAASLVFSTSNIRSLFPGVVATTQQAMEAVGNLEAGGEVGEAGGKVVQVEELCMRITMDVLGLLLRDRPFGAAELGPSRELEVVEGMCVSMQALLSIPFRRFMFWNAGWKAEREYIIKFDALIREMTESMQRDPPPPHTLGAHLLSVKDPSTGAPLSDLRLRSEVGMFILAGFETTGHSAALTLACIAAHPPVQARICAELDSLGLLGGGEGDPRGLQWEDVGKLKVLGAAVQESMRLLPVLPAGSFRITKTAVEVGGYTIPAGVQVGVPFAGLHRLEGNWREAEKYDIDRWLKGGEAQQGQGGEEEAEQEGARKGYMPFSEGPRNCVGQSLAKLELVAILAQLLGSFQVALAPEVGGWEGFLARLDTKLTLRPIGGLPCILTPR